MSTPSISWSGTHTVIGPKIQSSELLITGDATISGILSASPSDRIILESSAITPTQTVANNTLTTVNMWTLTRHSTNLTQLNGIVTILKTGTYCISTIIVWAAWVPNPPANPIAARSVFIFAGGRIYTEAQGVVSNSAIAMASSVTTQLNAGDTVSIIVLQNSGASATLSTFVPDVLSIVKI